MINGDHNDPDHDHNSFHNYIACYLLNARHFFIISKGKKCSKLFLG